MENLEKNVDRLVKQALDSRKDQRENILIDIDKMRKTVSESMVKLQESEDLAEEVLNMIGSKTVKEEEVKKEESKTGREEPKIAAPPSASSSSKSSSNSGVLQDNVNKQEASSSAGALVERLEPGVDHDYDRSVPRTNENKENQHQHDVSMHHNSASPHQPLRVNYQAKKPPHLIKDVKMPSSFTTTPTKRDSSSLVYPPIESLIKEDLEEGFRVWAMHGTSLMDPWYEGQIVEICNKEVGKGKDRKMQKQFKIKFSDRKSSKYVTEKQMAYSLEQSVRLPTGSRVIAVYKDEDEEVGDFFPAVVAECPTKSNKNRYLVFFDDGYASYLDHKDIRLVYSCDQDVWKDVDMGHRDFLRDYITQLPNKFMLTLKEGDKIKTELEGRMLEAEVNDVDASLVQVVFHDQTCHWIFRGSLRFEPMRKLKEKMVSKSRRGTIQPVEMTMMEPQKFYEHVCDSDCLQQYQYNPEMFRQSNPLCIPLHLGWRRQLVAGDFDDSAWVIIYITPCGRRLRNLEEVCQFLLITQSNLEIDFFAFDPWLTVAREFVPTSDFIQLQDISFGQERMPISACNSYDSAFPGHIQYSTVPVPQKDVIIDKDPGFLIGCDCRDGCENKKMCACRQLTIKSTVGDRGGSENDDAGYVHRRLQDVVMTGIYECNKTCKCSSSCLNRLVQFPIRSRLQIFRTGSCGWGIRCLDDLPQGAFVCTYVGKLYGPEEGNEQGKLFGDTYFADLDMIETVETRKEGFESDEDEDEGIDTDPEDEAGETKAKIMKKAEPSSNAVTKESEAKTETDKSDDNPEGEDGEESKIKSVRKYFGPDEDIYIMDAMQQGNIGRYLNHSCDPNVFVQNVFVDSHDIRFPTIAFFTIKYVPAGEELCWNYNYQVGSVEGKEMQCNCGASNCRGRLL